MAQPRPRHVIQYKLPLDLLAPLKRCAERSDRSMNAEITVAVRAHLAAVAEQGHAA